MTAVFGADLCKWVSGWRHNGTSESCGYTHLGILLSRGKIYTTDICREIKKVVFYTARAYVRSVRLFKLDKAFRQHSPERARKWHLLHEAVNHLVWPGAHQCVNVHCQRQVAWQTQGRHTFWCLSSLWRVCLQHTSPICNLSTLR